MKLIQLIAIPLILASCSGTADKDAMDIITLTDDGHTYTDTTTWQPGGELVAIGRATERNPVVNEATAGRQSQGAAAAIAEPALQCAIHKQDGKSIISLRYTTPGERFPISLSIPGAIGPGGPGIYRSVAHTATAPMQALSTYTRAGSGPYTVDSAMLNLTKADGDAIEATYTMYLTSPAGPKTVTGSVSTSQK